MYSSLFRVSCLLFAPVAAIQTTPHAASIQAHGNASMARKRDKPVLFIGVNVAAEHAEERQGIRDCWMKNKLMQGDNPPVVVKWMVATPDDGSPEKAVLEKDMAEHPGEFLQLDTPEGYYNLTRKSISFFQWAAQDQSAEYYMKIDEEIFPNIELMYNKFTENLENGVGLTYAGEFNRGSMPMTSGKWAQNPSVWWPGSAYPDFAAGDGYVISADLAKIVFQDNYDENMEKVLDNEDVNTGLWIENAKKKGVEVNYQLIAERCDRTCMPVGSDGTRCCTAEGPHTLPGDNVLGGALENAHGSCLPVSLHEKGEEGKKGDKKDDKKGDKKGEKGKARHPQPSHPDSGKADKGSKAHQPPKHQPPKPQKGKR